MKPNILTTSVCIGLSLSGGHAQLAALASDDAAVKRLYDMAVSNLSGQEHAPLAVRQLDQAIKLDPTKAYLYNTKASALAMIDEYEEALPCVNKALELDPHYGRAWNRKAQILFKLQWLDQALSCAEKAEKYSTEPIKGQVKSDILISLKRYEEALKELDKQLTLKPGNVSILGRRAEVYGLKNDWQKSADDLTDVMKVSDKKKPSYFALLFRRANCYVRLKEYDRAIADYQAGIKMNPDDRQAHAALMEVYEKTGKVAQAEAEKKYIKSLDNDLRLYK